MMIPCHEMENRALLYTQMEGNDEMQPLFACLQTHALFPGRSAQIFISSEDIKL